MEQYSGEEIDQIIDDTQFISLDIQNRILRTETETEIKEIDLDEKTDEYQLLRIMLHYVLGPDIFYSDNAADKLTIVCKVSCEEKFNKIIESGVKQGRKITDIALECCAELAYTLTVVNPLLVASKGGEYMRKSFMYVYSYLVPKIKEAREKFEKR